MLYVCATPIGNLEDITLRVLRILREADLIAAEDTRRTIKLLNHFDIHTPMTSLHEHNERAKTPLLLEKLREGQTVALVSDAGLPGISDPGQQLVAACREAGLAVTVCPGASAGVTAFVSSGLAGAFVFSGFPPADKRGRQAAFDALRSEPRHVILYEAPHRALKTLKELQAAIGERRVFMARELTKAYEETGFDTVGGHMGRLAAAEPRGEFVLIIEGAAIEPPRNGYPEDLAEHVAMYTAEGMDEKTAMRRAADDRGVTRREVYNALKRG